MTTYTYNQETSSTVAQVSYWLNLVHNCTEVEEQRYCYIRILEIDERHVYAKQRLLDLRNGPARTPKAIQTPLVPVENIAPKVRKPLEEEQSITGIVIDDKIVLCVSVIFFALCIAVTVIGKMLLAH